jgi:hypothetical protein
MILSLSLLLATSQVFRFPTEPISEELARGEQICYKGKGIERTLMEDRVAVGKWFDGAQKRETDQIIWLSPKMISRWLGYLNAKEKWSKEELNRRWSLMSAALDGKLTFVAELYALPKQSDLLEITEGANTKPETATNIRFLVTYLTDKERDEAQHIESMVRKKNPQSPLEREEPRVIPFGVFKAYSLDGSQQWPWHTLDPVFDPLSPEFAPKRPTAYDGIVGDYVRAIYVIQADLPEKPMPWERFEVRVFAPGKQPVARFSVAEKKRKG